MKKSLALCLAALMLAMPLASCAQTENTPTDTTADTAADVTTEAATTEDPLADNLPEDLNFDGYNFRIGSSVFCQNPVFNYKITYVTHFFAPLLKITSFFICCFASFMFIFRPLIYQ